jgi:hypothetical protein
MSLVNKLGEDICLTIDGQESIKDRSSCIGVTATCLLSANLDVAMSLREALRITKWPFGWNNQMITIGTGPSVFALSICIHSRISIWIKGVCTQYEVSCVLMNWSSHVNDLCLKSAGYLRCRKESSTISLWDSWTTISQLDYHSE